MESQPNKSPHTLFWIAGIAVTVFSAVGIAAILGWIPTSTSSPSESVVAANPPVVAAAPAKPAVATAQTAAAQERAQERAHDRAQERAHDRAQDRAQERARERAQVANNTPNRARCAECGVVESVREIATKGEGSGLGAVGGAVVGGVIGHQVGSGRGQDIATVVGAVGGAVAGNEVEKRAKSGKSYEITVRFEDGSSRVVHEANATSWRTGDRVKVINGVIQSNA
jgi:outer membrane lipoprotein SlyB